MFFTSVFMKKTVMLPEFHTTSENTIDSISSTVDKVKSKLRDLTPCESAGVGRLLPYNSKEAI